MPSLTEQFARHATNEFILECFLAKEGEELHVRKKAFRPFELGPHNCIGQELAMTELRVILALTVQDMDIVAMYPADGPRLFGGGSYCAPEAWYAREGVVEKESVNQEFDPIN
jgi:hypothetical protein